MFDTSKDVLKNKYTRRYIEEINAFEAISNLLLIFVFNPWIVLLSFRKMNAIRNKNNNLSYCILSILMIYWLIVTIVSNTVISIEIIAYYHTSNCDPEDKITCDNVQNFVSKTISGIFDF